MSTTPKNNKFIGVRLDNRVATKFEKLATRNHRTVSAEIRRLIDEALREDKEDQARASRR